MLGWSVVLRYIESGRATGRETHTPEIHRDVDEEAPRGGKLNNTSRRKFYYL